MNEQSHCVCNYLNKNQDKCQKKKNHVTTLLVQTLSIIHLPNNLMAKRMKSLVDDDNDDNDDGDGDDNGGNMSSLGGNMSSLGGKVFRWGGIC